MKYAIETKNLTKMYKKFTAVNSLNLTIEEGTIFGMLGHNGAGKTTTIKMLTCLIQPTFGQATVGGYDVKKNPDEVRKLLGMVPQQVSLYKDLTIKENAQMCADFYGVDSNSRDDRIDELMELVDIKYAQNKRIKQLSGGQKQKASLVASLVHKPDILFLDEPTIGLDPTTKRVLWDLIRDLNDDGHTIILCSHDMHEVDMLCDTVGIINTGNLVAYDSPQGLKDTLQRKRKEDHDEFMSAMETLAEEQIDSANLRKMSFIVNDKTDEIYELVSAREYVYNSEKLNNGRITLQIENFNDYAVNDVIKTVIQAGGVITSIETEEPSLEDVFITTTAEVDEDARA
ncbi:MAG: ATP-binding cassette domain-containing protein [archaeon]|nr:ATP-binding cassette domain-containing protein [archaeon]